MCLMECPYVLRNISLPSEFSSVLLSSISDTNNLQKLHMVLRTWHIQPEDWEIYLIDGGACGIIVIVAGIGHGDSSSKPGRDWLHFT